METPEILEVPFSVPNRHGIEVEQHFFDE